MKTDVETRILPRNDVAVIEREARRLRAEFLRNLAGSAFASVQRLVLRRRPVQPAA